MAELGERYIPYAGISGVVTVLRRLRNSSLPDVLDNQSIQRIGISKGIAGRTVAAIQFLGIIDETGSKTETHDRLAKASTNDYPDVLAEVLRNAYSEIFKVLDPANATDVDFHDAFRGFEPAKQRGRMVSLFMGLCQEANIIAGEPTIIRRRTTEAAPKPQSNTNGTPANEGKSDKSGNGNGTPPPSQYQTPPPPTVPYEMIAVVFKKLPQDGKWTASNRDLWLKGLEVALAMEIEIVEEDLPNNQ